MTRPGDTNDPFVARVASLAPGDGPTVAVKDMIGVEGLPLTAGFVHRRHVRATTDALAVARLKAAGHRVVGVTHTDAGGLGTMTERLINPRHPRRAVGGSSGGAAAAVAAGLATVGLGTDTGGSVRIPAAYCDLFAFKPTYGRVPLDGVIPLSHGFDHVGLMAADLAALTATLPALVTNWDRRAAEPGEVRCPLAVLSDAVAASNDDVADAFNLVCQRLGATIAIPDPSPYGLVSIAHGTLVCRDVWRQWGAEYLRRPGTIPESAAQAIRAGRDISTREMTVARTLAQEAAVAWRQAVDGFCAVLSPTLPCRPLARHAQTVRLKGVEEEATNANIRLTLAHNVSGLPVAVIPAPGVSVQVIGRHGEDEALLALVASLVDRLGMAPPRSPV
ncbi:MAG: amidase [Pseudomonadota bacterium]